MPMNVPGIDYSDMNLEAYDPLSGDSIADETANVDSLSPSDTTDVEMIAGDSDDSDCNLATGLGIGSTGGTGGTSNFSPLFTSTNLQMTFSGSSNVVCLAPGGGYYDWSKSSIKITLTQPLGALSPWGSTPVSPLTRPCSWRAMV